MNTYARCSRCKGRGWRTLWRRESIYFPAELSGECPDCVGTGYEKTSGPVVFTHEYEIEFPSK